MQQASASAGIVAAGKKRDTDIQELNNAVETCTAAVGEVMSKIDSQGNTHKASMKELRGKLADALEEVCGQAAPAICVNRQVTYTLVIRAGGAHA